MQLQTSNEPAGPNSIDTLTNSIKSHPYYSAAVAAILIYALAGFFLAPYLIETKLTETLRDDFNAELRFEAIEVNPFVLSLRVTGLALDNPQGNPTVRLGEFFGNFQLSSIFRLALTFDELRLSGPELYIARNQDGDMDFAYLIPAPKEEVAETAPDEKADDSLLPLLIHQFTIEDFVVNWSDQTPREPVQTRFGPIAVDIQDLNTLPNQSGQQTVVIATQNLGTLSWTGDLQLNPLRSSARATLESAQFDLVSAYVRHQAGIDIVDGSADIGLDYEVLQSEDGEIRARVTNFGLSLDNLIINSFADGSGFDFAGSDQRILKLPKVVIKNGSMQWPEQTASLGSISIISPQIDAARDEQGTFSLSPAPATEAPGAVESEPSSEANNEAAAEPDSAAEWQVAIGQLSINDLVFNLIDNSITPAAELGVSAFNLVLSDISNTQGARFPMTLALQAQSGGKVSLDGGITLLPDPAFDFELAVEGLQLVAANPYVQQQANLSMDSGAINLQARVTSSSNDPFVYNGNFEIADLVLLESVKNERLASWKRFYGDKIAFNLGQRQLDISQLQFDQLYGDILIDTNGTLNLGQVAKQDSDETTGLDPDAEADNPKQGAVAESLGPAAPDTETEQATDSGQPADEEPGFKIQIGGILLNDASADFADLALPLPFAVKIDALNGKMTTISNQSTEPSEVSLEGKVDEYGFARVSGVVTPLDPRQNTDILLTFDNIDVPKFTPYTIPFAGREIASGNLDLKLGYQVKDSQLVGENSIILRDFELGKEVPHPDALDIPLGLAVALLKDANGKIDIDLPVSGNVDSPEFSYGGVIWGALGNLLVKIVLSPFSFLGNLLGIEASELESINFLVGRSDLTPPQQQRAEKLAEALALRPELQLVIKGVYEEEADALALRTAQLTQKLELRIAELTAASDASILYPEHRRNALEALLAEELGDAEATTWLTELQTRFTLREIPEGQTEEIVSFDSLAYAAAINNRLVGLQELQDNALQQLATARANALQATLVQIDATLQAKILIEDNLAVTSEDGEPVEMPVTLNTGS